MHLDFCTFPVFYSQSQIRVIKLINVKILKIYNKSAYKKSKDEEIS